MGVPVILGAIGVEVTVWREERDRFGDRVYTGERKVGGCVVAPQTSSETGTLRAATVTTGLTLYAPYGANLSAYSRVRLADGTLWDVQGVPGLWRNPIGGTGEGEQVQLQRVTG
jgi:hypothetical protein